jgi:hypothetical protein
MTRRLLFVLTGAVSLAACSSSRTPAPAASVPETAVSAAPIACPDNTDTPQILEYTIGVAYRAFRANPSNGVPGCYVAAIGRNQKAFADSTIAMTMAMSDTLAARKPDDNGNLAGRLALLTRMKRYAEVPRTFDRLIARDPAQATLANYRLALAAAQRGQDTVARLRYLAAAAKKFPRTASIVADYNIQRQVPRLRALIDSTHRILRLDPRRTGAYATLASIYGNLDVPDSAIAYTKLALRRGVPRKDVAPSLQSLIGVVLRKAQLLDAPDIWTETLPTARAIDAALTTDASKHLLALSLTQVAAYQLDSLRDVLGGTASQLRSGARPAPSPATKAAACAGVRNVVTMLDDATARLDAGGARFSTSSVPAIRGAITVMRSQQADLAQRCTG